LFVDYRREILPELTTATIIGITVAVAGNILISLALNIQKLAHKRLDSKKAARNQAGKPLANSRPYGNTRLSSMEEDNEDDEGSNTATPINHTSEPGTSSSGSSETQPLLLFPQSQSNNDYGSSLQELPFKPKDGFLSRIYPSKKDPKPSVVSAMPVDVVGGESMLQSFPDNNKSSPTPTSRTSSQIEDGNESEYLQSKLWYGYCAGSGHSFDPFNAQVAWLSAYECRRTRLVL
jgi:magnesium transporter